MFSEVNTTLTDGIRSIDVLLKNITEERENAPDKIPIARWDDDSDVSRTVLQIKDTTKTISSSSVKMVLLYRANPTDAIFSSLLEESNGQLRTLIGLYFRFLEQKYAAPLFDSVSRAVRTLLSHVQDLVRAIESRQEQSLNYMAGMITKISDEIEKVPTSNKLAYRMHFMERCLMVKQTLDEFKGYLEEAHAKQAEAQAADADGTDGLARGVTNIALSADAVTAEDADGSEDSDFDDDCEDELDYTPRETVLVESCVKLIGKTLGALKNSLLTITTVCDATHANTVFTGVQQNSVAAYSEQWVAQLAYLAQALYKDVLNLGAELYPPFESDCAKIQDYFDTLKSHCADYLRLVQADALVAYQTEEGRARIAQLLGDVESCELAATV